MPILASFLRKNQRALKLSTLTTLNVLVTNYGKTLFSFVYVIIIPFNEERTIHANGILGTGFVIVLTV